MKEIGVDISNFYDKSSEGKKYEARTMELTSIKGGDSIQVKYNGVDYILGKGSFDATIDKTLKKDLVLRIASLIALSTDEDEIRLGIGLPINQVKTKIKPKALYETIKENSVMKISITENGIISKRTIKIKEVLILPEALGAFFSLPSNVLVDAKENDFDVLIIDIGGRTVDSCLISTTTEILDSDTSNLGTLTLYSDVKTTLDALYPELSIELEDIDKIVRNRKLVRPNGKEYDVSCIDELIKSYVHTIYNNISNKYPRLLNYKIILTGGGSLLLKDHLTLDKYFPTAYIHSDIFANAKGYKRALLTSKGIEIEGNDD